MWKFKKDYVCPDDKRNLARYRQLADYYVIKHNIAKRIGPSTILEIGVRAGYSALAFLSACPGARYFGIDAENDSHGGQDGPWMWWAEKLLSKFDATLSRKDSQNMQTSDLPLQSFGLIHVDGDHTVRGALHDMKLCWPAVAVGGIMLVDDYTYINTVKVAVDRFIAANPGIRTEKLKSLRGEVLFFKDQS
jgi:predicted O-methyltransferase YrrM